MEDNELHPYSIEDIDVTFEVSKLDKLIDFKELHPENIEDIDVTFEVSKFDKSIVDNELHS